MVYKVNCKNCNKIDIGETKFKMKKMIEEHKKDVDFKRISNSAIARHVEEFKHEIHKLRERKVKTLTRN